jgi:hypothetical protein
VKRRDFITLLEELTKAENSSLQELTVQGDCKETILKQLRLLGIDHFSVYGDLEHLARWLKQARNVRP